jgi:glycosidase
MLAAIVASTMMPTHATFQTYPDFAKRASDWRNGAVVYQVFVDRFVPPINPTVKAPLYKSPLRSWSEMPTGRFNEQTKVYEHVYDFWGGDLAGVTSKLPYLKDLGADVIYLNPIFESPTNHKYDTTNYFKIDPQLGTDRDFDTLVKSAHQDGLKVMLDGVFNHVGNENPIFTQALRDPNDSRRDWFFFGKQYEGGYRGWSGVRTMPGIKLENPAARKYFWGTKNGVVEHWLRRGVDGWRLDVAFELGPQYLQELTESAHRVKPGSAVIGEISGYPAEWFPSVDGVFNFTSMNVGIEMLQGNVSGGTVGRMYEEMVTDAGIENLLKSWLLTDNHDTPRFAHIVKNPETRHLVRVLQMTLPGSPCLYYGSELGLEGSGDPSCRGPMPWDQVNTRNRDLTSTKQLLTIRKTLPALRYGDFRALATNKLLAYARTTNKVEQAVLVVMNPTNEKVKETFTTRVGRILSWGEMTDVLTGRVYRSTTGMFTAEMEPRSVAILTVSTAPWGGYTPYQRLIDN